MSEKLTYEELEKRVLELEQSESERKQARDVLRNEKKFIDMAVCSDITGILEAEKP